MTETAPPALHAVSGPRRPAASGPTPIDIGRVMRVLAAAGLAASLVACASSGAGRRADARPSSSASPSSSPAWETDGPGASPPADLASIPDAEPVVEPMRSGAMRPYEVLGRTYTPITEDVPVVERGLASWYGRKFQGRPTASGERYDMYAMTAAHPTLPLPSYVRVRNPANQREVIVRINDRGPFHPGRIIDLSYTAAWKLDLLRGVAPVEIERITNREIQAGTWRRGAPAGGVTVAAVRPETVRRGRAAVPVQPYPPGTPAAAATAPTMAVAAPLPVSATTPAVPSPPLPGSAAVPATPSWPSPGNEAPSIATPLPVAAPAPVSVTALPAVDARPVAVASGYWVQLGAFRYRDGAENFQRQVVADVGWIASALSVRSDAELHRLQAGPYADRDEAAGVAQRLRESLQLVPVIVERR